MTAKKKWNLQNRKPTWSWKAKDSSELEHFSVPFAVKEYMQNIGGQILKDLNVREWNDWTREDLRGKTIAEQTEKKRSLEDAYPGLLTGPHGVSLSKQKLCLPLYILSANVPLPPKTELTAVVVLWSTGSSRTALTFFNNHLDDNATFESFAIDGESTSKANAWAVGEKGKGFILATQYLAEHIAEAEGGHSPKLGISFRVGEQIGELKWMNPNKVPSLRVALDDLTTRTVEEYLEHRCPENIQPASDSEDSDSDDASQIMIPAQIRKKATAILDRLAKRRVTYGLDGKDNKSRVKSDEVCITIVGIAAEESDPKHLFSAIFGIIPPASRWRVPGTPIEFFLHETAPQFYHRDQLVPYGPHLNKLSINYHGDLRLSSERAMVLCDQTHFPKYKKALGKAIHDAFRTIPDLAAKIAEDILTDNHSDGFAWILSPSDKEAAAQYRDAFESIWAQGISHPPKFHPHLEDDILVLTRQLELEPIIVRRRVLDILRQSGAYGPISEHARKQLLESPSIQGFPGLNRIRAALRALIPDMPSENISVREYALLSPPVACDEKHNLLALARPKACQEHPTQKCLCWIGPRLNDIANLYKGTRTAISTTKLWSAFATIMGGDTIVERPTDTSGGSGASSAVSMQSTATPPSPARASANNRPVATPKEPYKLPSNTGVSAAPKSSSAPAARAVNNASRAAHVHNQTTAPLGTIQSAIVPNPAGASSAVLSPSSSTLTATNNAPRAPHNQVTALSAATPVTGVSMPGDASSAPAQPRQNTAGAISNEALVAQLSARLLGFDPVQKNDELVNKLHFHEKLVADQGSTLAAHERRIQELITSVTAKDTQIAELKRNNKRVRDYLAVEEAAAREAVERATKRPRME
ncbi:hypothetical protein C8R45DRAFT_1222036 [Mycena sanguinolenta]|nr:hypothetical protein C8R45DRAFT_1222036 [Mycena sanguinolenta]